MQKGKDSYFSQLSKGDPEQQGEDWNKYSAPVASGKKVTLEWAKKIPVRVYKLQLAEATVVLFCSAINISLHALGVAGGDEGAWMIVCHFQRHGIVAGVAVVRQRLTASLAPENMDGCLLLM